MQLSYDDYDKIMDFYFDRLGTPTLWPEVTQIDKFEEDPGRWLLFACYLYEKGEKPKTNAEKYSKKNIRLFIDKHLTLTDDTPRARVRGAAELIACLDGQIPEGMRPVRLEAPRGAEEREELRNTSRNQYKKEAPVTEKQMKELLEKYGMGKKKEDADGEDKG